MPFRVPRVVVSLAVVSFAFSVTLVASGAPPTPAIVGIDVGGSQSCALTRGNGVKCWGYNVQGQLGHGVKSHNSPSPVDVAGLRNGVRAIATGGGHACALTTRGGVKCWGWNSGGQLGNGSPAYQSNTPVDVKGLGSGVTAIAAGGGHTCALTSRGGVKCWGFNGNGQLGNDAAAYKYGSRTPVDVKGLTSGVVAIAADGQNGSTTGGQTCALTAAGGVKCWGYEPGTGAPGCCSLTPVDVAGLSSGVRAIISGCALTRAGGVKCWGGNAWGEVGNGSTTPSRTPVDVAGLTSGVRAITAGARHNCALTSGGGVKCWGWNGSGQLGNRSTTDSSSPVDVVGLRARSRGDRRRLRPYLRGHEQRRSQMLG
jgi:alpha-tubulin suppressor-like RCC1 family protein